MRGQHIEALLAALADLDPVMRRVVIGIAQDAADKARAGRPSLRLVAGGAVTGAGTLRQKTLPHR